MNRGSLMRAESSWIREIWLCYLNRDLDWAEAGFKHLSSNKLAWLNRAAKAFLYPLSLISKGAKCALLCSLHLLSKREKAFSTIDLQAQLWQIFCSPNSVSQRSEAQVVGMAQSAKLSGDFQDAPAGKVKPGGGGGLFPALEGLRILNSKYHKPRP